jgi:hypothetical protein
MQAFERENEARRPYLPPLKRLMARHVEIARRDILGRFEDAGVRRGEGGEPLA